MGLPMWRDPTMVDVPRTSATKSDPTATARSTIRRQRTIRSPNRSRIISPEMNERIAAMNARLDARRRRHVTSQQLRLSPNASSRTQAQTTLLGNVEEDSPLMEPLLAATASHEADRAREAASDRHRQEQDRPLLRDALSYERPWRRSRDTGSEGESSRLQLPPVPEVGSLPQPDRHSNAWTRYSSRMANGSAFPADGNVLVADGSNDSLGDTGFLDWSDNRGSLTSGRRSYPALTRNYPPAQHARPATRHGRREGSSRPRQLPVVSGVPDFGRMGNRSSAAYTLDPRYRARRINPATSPNRIDGLGDRERSFSPGDDGDHWETMLTTITPDAQLPSAYSSFTSAAASASASFSASHSHTNTNSASSLDSAANTNITVPTSADEEANDPDYEPFLACDPSDTEDSASLHTDFFSDEPTDNELESIRRRSIAITNRINSLQRNAVPPNPPSPPRSRSPRNYHLFNRDQTNESAVSIAEELEIQRRQRERDNENEMEEPHELRFMQRVLRGLTQREDIPDSWWAQVGLARTLRIEGEGATGAVAAAARL